MADVIAEIVKGVIALFIIVDPLGNVPIFLGLTEKMSTEERSKTFRTATLVGLVYCCASPWLVTRFSASSE